MVKQRFHTRFYLLDKTFYGLLRKGRKESSFYEGNIPSLPAGTAFLAKKYVLCAFLSLLKGWGLTFPSKFSFSCWETGATNIALGSSYEREEICPSGTPFQGNSSLLRLMSR
jgi:hypothetical protein